MTSNLHLQNGTKHKTMYWVRTSPLTGRKSLDVIDTVIHDICKRNIRGRKHPYIQIFSEGWEETFSISHTISRELLKYIIRLLCFYLE